MDEGHPLFELIAKLKKAVQENPLDTESDPKKFPYSAKIEDDQALLYLAQMTRLKEEAVQIAHKLDMKKKEIDLVKSKLFERLYEFHPEAQIDYDCSGTRRVGEDVYLVAYDEPKDFE